MAIGKTGMRVAALGLMGGAMALFAAQAGVLPGLDLGPDSGAPLVPTAMAVPPGAPGATTPVDIVADAYAQTQALVLPDVSGFVAAPETLPLPAVARTGATDLVRPAAFAPAAALVAPGAPAPEAPAPEGELAQELSPFGLPCGLDVTADATDAAMVALGVAAPCHPEAIVTITHAGLTVAQRTDAFGLLTLDLPALASPAVVTVTLPDGTMSDVGVAVPGLSGVDRVALTWRGDLGVSLHVFEDGAAWMSPGHVHAAAPRDVEASASGQGFLTVLGDPTIETPLLAQVYTLPRQGGPGAFDVSIDAPVTQATCTQTAEAQVLETRGGTRTAVVPLRVTYPACDAVGDTLVLQNVVRDLRLAAN